jgi:putative isomerase
MTALGEQRQASAARDAAPLSAEARRQGAEALLHYFAANAELLLRAPGGILTYPSIAPSLPGKQYSAQLWDWDTLWTSRGLFRLAALTHDEALKQKLCEHVSGSLLNFLDHASAEGRIPILMTPTNPDPFRVLGSNGVSKNQAKPVFGQLGLLAADQRGEIAWLAPHFDTMLRFYDSWTAHNMSSIGLLVWGDDVAIGDDNDPTTFGRPFFRPPTSCSTAFTTKTCARRPNSRAGLDARRISPVSPRRPARLRSKFRSTAGTRETATTIRPMFNVSTGAPN